MYPGLGVSLKKWRPSGDELVFLRVELGVGTVDRIVPFVNPFDNLDWIGWIAAVETCILARARHVDAIDEFRVRVVVHRVTTIGSTPESVGLKLPVVVESGKFAETTGNRIPPNDAAAAAVVNGVSVPAGRVLKCVTVDFKLARAGLSRPQCRGWPGARL